MPLFCCWCCLHICKRTVSIKWFQNAIVFSLLRRNLSQSSFSSILYIICLSAWVLLQYVFFLLTDLSYQDTPEVTLYSFILPRTSPFLSIKWDLLGSENFSSMVSLIIASAPFFSQRKSLSLLLTSCPPCLSSSLLLFPLVFHCTAASWQSVLWVFSVMSLDTLAHCQPHSSVPLMKMLSRRAPTNNLSFCHSPVLARSLFISALRFLFQVS